MDERTTNATNGKQDWTKWLPWIIQFALLIWGAATINSSVNSLEELGRETKADVITLRNELFLTQIKLAELRTEVNLINATPRRDR